MTEGVAILTPVLGRPQNVRPLLDSIAAVTPDPWRVCFICDVDDLTEIRAVHEALEADPAHVALTPLSGKYAQKINAGVKMTAEPLLFLGADDLHFHPGWLEAATARLAEGFHVVGTQDHCNPRTIRGEHATHFLVTREYAERGQLDGQPGLLCEVYAHNSVDDELIATATRRGAYAFAGDSIVEHRHPMAGTAEMDPTYEKAVRAIPRDRRAFRRRKRIWAA